MILQPNDFGLETTTIWSFPTRGSWATHTGSYRGNWSPYVPRNLILRYSNPGDWVLDQFMGSGTTAVACEALNRKWIGIEMDEGYFTESIQRIEVFVKGKENECKD